MSSADAGAEKLSLRRWLTPHRDRLPLEVMSQAISAATNVLATIGMARNSSVADLGRLSVVLAVYGLGVMALAQPLGQWMVLTGGPRLRRPARLVGTVVGVSFLVGTAAGSVTIGVGGAPYWFLTLVVFGALCPLLWTHEILRILAFGRRDGGRAVLLDGLWFGGTAVGLLVLEVLDAASGPRVLAVWAVAGTLAALFGVGSGGSGAWRRAKGPRAQTGGTRLKLLMADGLLLAIPSQFVIIGLAVLTSEENAGVMRVALAVVGPATVIAAGLTHRLFATIALLERDGDAAAVRRATLRHTLAIGSANIVILTVIGALPTSFWKAGFGDAGGEVRGAYWLFLAASLAQGLTAPPAALLRVVDQHRLVRTRVVTVVIYLGTLALGASWIEGATSVGVFLVIVRTADLVNWWSRGGRYLRALRAG